jgi:hypothetical protein
LKCPEAETVDGVTCQDLCRQIVTLGHASECVAHAASCNEANNCTDGGLGSAGSGG